MRMALFAAVVAVHIALVWYFLSLWHVTAASEDIDQPSMTMVFLPPMEPVTATGPVSGATPATSAHNREGWQAPQLYRNARGGLTSAAPSDASPESAVPSVTAKDDSTAISEPDATANIDWHTQAEIVAQADAQHIVESEDRAARQAGALTAMTKAHHRGPHNPVIPFGWDPNPRYRWQPAQGGGFTMALNDHCQVFVLIMVFVGCTVGELPPARGDLFKNMHPPVKFGDWDWRLDDP